MRKLIKDVGKSGFRLDLHNFIPIWQKNQNYEASIFTGEEEIFAFERTVSRLREMQGEEYWSMDRKIPRPHTHRN